MMMACPKAPTNHAEVHAMPAFGSRRDQGKPTLKMTGSSSSAIGYVKSQVKKFSDQFFQSPVSVRGPRLLWRMYVAVCDLHNTYLTLHASSYLSALLLLRRCEVYSNAVGRDW